MDEWVKKIAEMEAQNAVLTESRDFWKREWRLMESAEKKAEGQIAALAAENERLKKREESRGPYCEYPDKTLKLNRAGRE